MKLMSDDEGQRDVAIKASFQAREVRVKVPPRTRVSFVGEGEVETRRKGIPPRGMVLGATYLDVEAATEITSRAEVRRRYR
jgi:hypothetical protein